jgi:hypothetical protein
MKDGSTGIEPIGEANRAGERTPRPGGRRAPLARVLDGAREVPRVARHGQDEADDRVEVGIARERGNAFNRAHGGAQAFRGLLDHFAQAGIRACPSRARIGGNGSRCGTAEPAPPSGCVGIRGPADADRQTGQGQL